MMKVVVIVLFVWIAILSIAVARISEWRLSRGLDIAAESEQANGLHGDILYIRGEIKYLTEEVAFLQQKVDALRDNAASVQAKSSQSPAFTLAANQVGSAENPTIDPHCTAEDKGHIYFVLGRCMTIEEVLANMDKVLANRRPISTNRHDVPAVRNKSASLKPAVL